MANFYISDLHFGCNNKWENRTLEHDKLIIENWNNIVTNADNVYILGDFGRCGTSKDNEYLCECISKLRGKNKILIKGNHDNLKDIRLQHLFTEICDYKEIKDNNDGVNYNLTLSHYPQLFWNGQHKGWIHLYGHLHKSEEYMFYQESLKRLNDYFLDKEMKGRTDCPQAKAYNVGCMLPYMDYTPRTLKEIMNG